MRRLIAACLFLITLSASAQDLPTDPNATLLAEFGRGEVKSVRWSPDGESVWVGTSAGTWELDADLNERRAFPDIKYGALSPDGTWLAGYDAAGAAKIWDAANPQIEQSFYRYNARGFEEAPTWSPTSRAVIFPAIEDKTSNYLYRNNSGILSDEPDDIRGIGDFAFFAWSPSGRYLAGYTAETGIVRVLEFEEETYRWTEILSLEIYPLPRQFLPHFFLRWNSESQLALSTDVRGEFEFRERVWDIPSGEVVDAGCDDSGRCDISPSGEYHIGYRGLLRVGRVDGELLYSFPVFDVSQPHRLVWAGDSQKFAISTARGPSGLNIPGVAVFDYMINLFGLESETPLWTQTDLGFRADRLIWSPNNERLLAADRNFIVILDAESGEIIAQTRAFMTLDLMSLNSTGQEVAFSEYNGSVFMLDLTIPNAQPKRMALPDAVRVRQLEWQPNGDKIIVSDYSNLWVWDVREDEIIDYPDFRYGYPRFRPNMWQLTAASWILEGNILVYPTGNSIRLEPEQGSPVDFTYEEMMRPLQITRSNVFESVYWPPESDAPYVALTDTHVGEDYVAFAGSEPFKLGNRTANVIARRIHPDGRLMVLRGDDVPTYHPSLYPVFHDGIHESVLMTDHLTGMRNGWISPLGTQVAVIDQDGNGLIWDNAGYPLHFLSHVRAVIWSPDDSQAAIVRVDGSLWRIDADNRLLPIWRPAVSISWPRGFYNHFYLPGFQSLDDFVRWSADGTTIAYNYGGVVRVWRLGE